MGKQVSLNAINFLNQRNAAQPLIIVGIYWGGGVSWYSTRPIPGYNANITSVGTIQSQRRVDTMCNSSSVTIEFSDTDGSMKTIVDGRNCEKAPAVAYLAFNGSTTNDMIELIRGKTASPVQWNEGERTFSISIESETESRELGFSATHEDFNDIMEGAEGVPWPMIFGTCAHVPALQVREHTVGHLKFPIQLLKVPSWRHISDTKTILLNESPDVYSHIATPPVKNKIYVEGGEKFPQDEEIRISIFDVIFKGRMNGELFTVTEANAPRYTNLNFATRETDADTNNNKVAWIAEIPATDNQDAHIPSLINHHVYFNIPGPFVEGKVWYNYVVKQIGPKVWFRYPVINPVNKTEFKLTSGYKITKCYTTTINGMSVDVEKIIWEFNETLAGRRTDAGRSPFGKLVQTLTAYEESNNSWWQAPSDEEVYLWNQEDPDIYVASFIEMSNIKAVFGKRKVKMPDGKTKDMFQQIPSSYYQKQLQSNYSILGQFASGLLFFKSLSSYAGQDWTGEIYVTGTSTIGPNSADIMKWILNNFTDLTPDVSFNSVAVKVEPYEAHFALFDKRDALRIVNEIAFQARCGLILDSERVGIRFLADVPTTLSTISDANTHLDSLTRTFTLTSDITTKLIGSYTESYREKNRLSELTHKNITRTERVLRSLVPSNRRSKSDTKYTIYSENIDIYGLKPREESFYIYVNVEDVQVALQFWGHRFANPWQLVSVKIPLEGSILQVFDGVYLEYNDSSLLQINTILGEILEVNVNPQEWSVNLLIMLPRVSGSVSIDSLVWPGA